ncbi:MAG: hypothetical protein J2P21_25400 [Chloracidobacterium sp.]|nr:hypothetical protein [Chloracidobacterium sp.]
MSPCGNGAPLIVAPPHIPEGEGFIYAYGDDILKTRVSFARRLIETHKEAGALVAGVQAVPWEEVSRYGVVGGYQMKDVIEKPSREEAKSNLAMFGRFLLSTEVIQILSEIPLGKSNELLADRRGARIHTPRRPRQCPTSDRRRMADHRRPDQLPEDHDRIGRTIKIPLEREMRRIDAPFNDCRLIRFDVAVRTRFRPSELWVAFNRLDYSHDQPVTCRIAGCYKPAVRRAACASAR